LRGGVFNVSGSATLGNLAEWNGTSWSSLGGMADGEVDAILAVATNKVFIGGHLRVLTALPQAPWPSGTGQIGVRWETAATAQ